MFAIFPSAAARRAAGSDEAAELALEDELKRDARRATARPITSGSGARGASSSA